MEMSLAQVADNLNAEVVGADARFMRVSTDTRTLQPGDLFVALVGEHFDGHDYVEAAHRKGAIAAMVSRRVETDLPLLMVPDTRISLGAMASFWRKQFSIPVAAVTGSNGKTTVKEMIAAIMRQKTAVLATQGNLNNDIGVPLTLLRMQDEHGAAVIELGANHIGEIQYLSGLTRPNVAVITNAASAHLEGFGNLEGVARGKGEIFSGLDLHGVAVINADDDFAPYWLSLTEQYQRILFGLQLDADVTADWQPRENGTQMLLHTPFGEAELLLPLPGRHNVMNALAATAVSLATGADPDHVVAGLSTLHTVKGRLQVVAGLPGMRILNDTYNANPTSLEVALEVLQQAPGHRWLVLGDMGELGAESAVVHGRCGMMARDYGVERLYALGELSRNAVSAFGEGAYWFESVEQLLQQIRKDWKGTGSILVKGSRVMRMERIVEGLLGSPNKNNSNGEHAGL